MSTKFQGPKATTILSKATTTTNLRQTKIPAKSTATTTATTKFQKGQSAPTARSYASFSAPTTTRSTNSTTSSVSACSHSRRSISSNRTFSRSCTNTTKTTTANTTTTTSKSSTNTTNNKRFITHTNNNKSSPFRSFITRGPRARQPTGQANDFAYDLSKDETKFMGAFKGPMKAVPDKERELLKSGQRGAYLAVRYEHSPDRKYNYPEATSWRIGWFHNEQSRQQGVAV